MNSHKNQLIDELILPALTQVNTSQKLIDRLYEQVDLHESIKYQKIEVPGTYHDGRLWLSTGAMVHAYFFCPDTKEKWGTRIWRKKEFILNTSSLLNQEFRTDYLEILEPGELLSISYGKMLALMIEFPELEKQVQNIAACNEMYYHRRNQLLHKPALERVLQFEKENPLFINVASKDAIAMHVGLTRQGYGKQLRESLNKVVKV